MPTRQNGFSTPFLVALNRFMDENPVPPLKLRFVRDGVVIGFQEEETLRKFEIAFSECVIDPFEGDSTV